MIGKIITLICVSATMLVASTTRMNVTTMGIATEFKSAHTEYKYMSTNELEKEVERLTLSGDVPFDMGVELIKRWTKG